VWGAVEDGVRSLNASRVMNASIDEAIKAII
jgi:hypothetical protein